MLQVGLKGEPFSSVQKALDFLKMHPEEERYILVRPGVYKERVVVGIPGVVITGESREAMERTVITLGLGAREILFWEGRRPEASLVAKGTPVSWESHLKVQSTVHSFTDKIHTTSIQLHGGSKYGQDSGNRHPGF